MAVLCCRQFIMAYDTGSMNVAISTIVAVLDIILTGVQTVIVGGVSEPKAYMRAEALGRTAPCSRTSAEGVFSQGDEDVS